ncbi:PREDICTED: zinc finger protein 70-like [Rhagoletis zephyria]|uniref:zinc finger protein 70-like n=1 Tax=Rhagoletis zephyria TaxID=28612 RepID=UPI0008112F5F|nr:PREDICTED: zinc finger protein 70-like [Rhagoletis zephyria]
MSETEQLSGANDMYDDELDCVYEEGKNKEVDVKEEEEDSETDYDAVGNFDQSAGNAVIKTEEQNETTIDMFDDEFHAIMERDFSAEKNANEASEAVRVNEEHETDLDATEIEDDDYSAVSEPEPNTEPVVNCISSSASGEQQRNGRRGRVKSHKCQQCGKSFPSPSALKLHQVVHTGIRAYKCPTCSKSFGLKGNLTTHQRFVHTDSRPFQCSICEKTFKWKLGLKKHLHAQHQQ